MSFSSFSTTVHVQVRLLLFFVICTVQWQLRYDITMVYLHSVSLLRANNLKQFWLLTHAFNLGSQIQHKTYNKFTLNSHS